MAVEMILTPEQALAHIDDCIDRWRELRNKRVANQESIAYRQAVCYVDAWQSARISLFGELKP